MTIPASDCATHNGLAVDRTYIAALLKRHGGSTHGPHVETVSIPEAAFYRMMDEFSVASTLTADFVRALPGGKLDDSTCEQIETALDRADAPCTDAAGKWLTLPERVAALAGNLSAALRSARALIASIGPGDAACVGDRAGRPAIAEYDVVLAQIDEVLK